VSPACPLPATPCAVFACFSASAKSFILLKRDWDS
jgi:hypothetical protein